jgi:DNA-binding NarL/FixJ family response regulator
MNLFCGCLGFWLRGSCPEFEITATPDLEYLVEEGSARRIAAVVIGSDIFQGGAAWVEKEVARFRLRLPNVPVVAIEAGDMVRETEDWINWLGLSGYILTSSSTEVGSAALRLVIAGGKYFPRTDGHSQLGGQASIDSTLELPLSYVATKLTLRERAVFDRLRQGSPNKIIAHELNISLGTVKPTFIASSRS